MFKKLINSTALYMIAGALPSISGMILLVPYTSYLSSSMYGALSIYISFSLLTQILITYSIDNYVAMGYVHRKNDSAELSKFVGTLVFLITIISFGCLFIFTLLGIPIFKLFKNDLFSFLPYGLMSLIFAISNVYLKIYSTLLIYKQEPFKYLLINLVNFILILFLSVYGLKLYPNSLFAPITARLIAGSVTLILVIIFLLKEFGIHFDKSQLKGVNKFCFPVFKYNIYSWIITYSNNYIILLLDKTTKVLGVFDFAMKCTLITEVFQNSFCSTINPKIYNLWSSKDRESPATIKEEYEYHLMFSNLNILFISFSIFFIPLIGEIIIKNKEYILYFKYLPYLMLPFLFRPLINIYTNIMYYYHETKVLPKMVIISALFQIAFMYFLYEFIHIWAAIIAALISKIVQLIILKFSNKKNTFEFYFAKPLIIIPMIYSVLILILFSGNYLNYYSGSLIQLIIVSVYILFTNKNLLMKLNRKISYK